MSANLEGFKKDLASLIDTGRRLKIAIKYDCFPDKWEEAIRKHHGEKSDEFIEALPNFREQYQRWYSEALVLIRQLLPDRVSDFVRHYEKPRGRKNLTNDSYRVEDYLQGLSVTLGTSLHKETVVGPEAAIPHVEQQLAIVEATEARFESSLFEIRQLVQADLLDSELQAAEELAKHNFVRAAGAVAGVVLEKHLAQVCSDHQLILAKKKPTIADFNEALKAAAVVDVPQWRFIQHLADIRNLCDHARTPEPTAEQVVDLVGGVKKVTKTVY